MKHLSKRVLALLLCLVLCFSLLPVTVLAEEEQPAEVTLEEMISVEEPAEEPAEELTEEPAEEPAEEPTEEPVEESLEPVSEEAPALLAPAADTDILTEDYFPDKNLLAALKEEFPDGLTLAQATKVTYLDLIGRGISDATGLEYFSALEDLNFEDNSLTALDLSAFPELYSVECHNNLLTELDVSGNEKLEYLQCSKNALTKLNVSGCTALKRIICADNALRSLEVSSCEALVRLECEYNCLTKLDVSNNADLEVLICSNNALVSISLCEAANYTHVICSENRLTSFSELDGCKVAVLDCSGNQISELPIAAMRSYPYSLNCSRNSIISLPEEFLEWVADDSLIMDSLVAPATLDAIYCDATFGDNCADMVLIDTSALQTSEAGRNFLYAWVGSLMNGMRVEPLNAETMAYCVNWDEGYIQYMLIPAAAVQNGSIYLQQQDRNGPVVELPLNLLPTNSEDNAEYLLLSPGSTVTVPYSLPFAGLAEYLEENLSPMTLLSGFFNSETQEQNFDVSVALTADGISISVPSEMEAQSGIVRVMAMVKASSESLGNGDSYFVLDNPIRVDIAGESLASAVKDVTLATTKVTDEFFKTARAEITVIPELEMNARVQSPEAEKNVGIQSAEFTNAALKELYTLTVKDDRTLVLEPNPAAGYAVLTGAKIAGTYKSAIVVTISDAYGSETFETAAQVAVTVKTSQPKLKASPIKLNSYLPAKCDKNAWVVSGIGAAPVITGGTVKGFVDKEGDYYPGGLAFRVDSMSMEEYWDYIYATGMTPKDMKLYYVGEAGAKWSDTITTTVLLEEWTDAYGGWPVTAKISVAPVAPTLKLSSKSITVYPGFFEGYSRIRLTPSAAYADQPISIARMVETLNKQTFISTGEYFNGRSEAGSASLEAWISQENGETYLNVKSYSAADYSAKLYLELAGKEFPVSIKVKGAAKNMPSAVVKATGTIDTALRFSKLDLKATMKNAGSEQPYACVFVTKIYSEKKGTEPVIYYSYADDIDKNAFGITDGEDLTATIRLLDPSQLDATRTYYADTVISYNQMSKEDLATDEGYMEVARAKLSVKASKTTPKPTVKVKTSGTVDLTTGAGLTANFTIKNSYGYGYLILNFTRIYNAQDPKGPKMDMGQIVIGLTDGALAEIVDRSCAFKAELAGNSVKLTPDFESYNYSKLTAGDKIKITAIVEAPETEATTAFTTTLKASKNVIKLGTSSVTMSRNDVNDLVTIPVSSSGLPISVVGYELDDKAAQYFNLSANDDDTLLLSWADKTTPASKLPAAVTAKLKIYVRDPATGTIVFYSPQTVTLKINIK